MCLERATIAGRQGASEDQKFVAKPTQLNMNLFLADGIYLFQFKRTQKDDIESSFKSNKKLGCILSSICTPTFYSISKALNAVLLGAIELEEVLTRSEPYLSS